MKSPPTAVSLLLTNLRLLDYDNDPETSFPITPEVFTSLKNKGKAFEHIVHHLFYTLDPEECALRLDVASWPIFEPAQSRELRNAAFKWLSDLKKDGRLGGNILIRRTLLDDCSGDRYEELLLSLSTAVLRDQIEKGRFKDEVMCKTFAYKQTSPLVPSPKALEALILAHESSLTRLLHSRRLSKSQWSSFAAFLNSKEAQLSAIAETPSQQAISDPPAVLPRGYEEEVMRKWRNNWLGDQRWLEILLKGDPEYMRDPFFELPFQKALIKHHHFKNGLAGVRNGDVSLLALEKQIQEQKNRLRELRQIREEALRATSKLDASNAPSKPRAVSATRKERKDLKVVFDKHQSLHNGQVKVANDFMAKHRNEYTELMDSLREDLAAAGMPMRRQAATIMPSGHRFNPVSSSLVVQAEYRFEPAPSSPAVQPELPETSEYETKAMDSDEEMPDSELPEAGFPASEYSRYDNESDIEMSEPPQQKPYDHHQDSPMIKVSQQIEDYDPQPATSSDASYQDNDEDNEGFSEFEEPEDIPNLPSSHLNPSSPLPPPQRESRIRDSPGFRDLGDDELIAEQIVSTMAASTFSPEKPSPVKSNQQWHAYKPPALDDTFDFDESRLRLNSDQTDSTPQKRNLHLPFLNSANENHSTPIRAPPLASPTRKEDLLRSTDYNSVFKSRPKIAVSPILTPAGGTSLPNLSLVSGMSMNPETVFSDDFAAEYAASPLARRNARKGGM